MLFSSKRILGKAQGFANGEWPFFFPKNRLSSFGLCFFGFIEKVGFLTLGGI